MFIYFRLLFKVINIIEDKGNMLNINKLHYKTTCNRINQYYGFLMTYID